MFVNNLLIEQGLVLVFGGLVLIKSSLISPDLLVQLGTVNNNNKQQQQHVVASRDKRGGFYQSSIS